MTRPNHAPTHTTARRAALSFGCAAQAVFDLVLGAIVLCLLAIGAASGAAADEAEASQRSPVAIKIFLSSRSDVCFDPGDVAAIKRLATLEREKINEQGGINGRRLDLQFLDDVRDATRTVANVRSAVSDPETIAMIGLGNADRAKKVFAELGPEVKASGIPFLSSIMINSIYADYPNVFTMRASQDDERMPVLIQFTKQLGAIRPAFVGIKDAIFSDLLADGLKSGFEGKTPLVVDHRLVLKDDKLDPAEILAAVAELKQKGPDLVFLSIGSNRNVGLIKEMMAANITPPLFISGRIDDLPREITDAYPSDIYQIAWDRLPDVYNDRLRQRISRSDPAKWVFEGRRISEAPGWSSGECKPRDSELNPDPLSDDNLRAIGNGSQVADMVRLVVAAARTATPPTDVAKLRAEVIDELKTTYATGRGTFPGSFDNWSFRPNTRAAARVPFIVQLAHGRGRTQLAPVQFVRLKNEVLRPVSTLYLDIDLLRAFRIDDNEKSFFAEFNLAMRDDGKDNSIDAIEFSNAFLNPETNDRQLTIRTLNAGGKSDAYPDDMKIYQVSGRFMFEPRLANYPFDTQRFAIDIRPKRGDAPFIIQPPPESLRDRGVIADGWEPKEQYVGYDEDFVATIDAKSHDQSVVPFYKASFVWMMSRQTTDYFLRVVVPLTFILIVAYLSIFIPRTNFEAIVTIQVTALLSAVALYLALPKIDADTTTLSDRIFLFTYMSVSVMIAISIMRINRHIAARKWLRNLLLNIHVVAIPLMGLLMALYVHRASLAGE